jgi:hypothetical protein
MKYSKWIGVIGVLVLILACFQPWMFVASKNLTISGFHTEGTNFGRPALVNVVLSAIAALLFLSSSVMGKRFNIFFCAFNMAWAFRNFLIMSICRSGECPEKKAGIYLLLAASLLMMIAALFPDIKLKEENEKQNEKENPS